MAALQLRSWWAPSAAGGSVGSWAVGFLCGGWSFRRACHVYREMGSDFEFLGGVWVLGQVAAGASMAICSSASEYTARHAASGMLVHSNFL